MYSYGLELATSLSYSYKVGGAILARALWPCW